jgi:CheY-like chemotaxis protein
MTLIRILHVDDEQDIREVAAISLGLDPGIITRSAGSGEEALSVAADWLPDLILLDVMMPTMDGPATLARLRDNPSTADIPVIFMTARAQTRELDRFRTLGAIGVIPKPFDPMTLAISVRQYIEPVEDPMQAVRSRFLVRANHDVAALATLRSELREGTDQVRVLSEVRRLAHGLAGAGGIFGFDAISETAAVVEDAIIVVQSTADGGDVVTATLDRLIATLMLETT